MTLASVREHDLLDVLGATGGVRVFEPDVTGIDKGSFNGWVAGLTMGRPAADSYFLVETPSSWSGLGIFSTDPTCVAIAKEAGTAVEPEQMLWSVRFGEGLASTGCGYFIERSFEPNVHERDWRWAVRAPSLFGLGSVALATVHGFKVARAVNVPEATESAELVEAAQRIRELTKLSVQDVGAMLGIKRRQFYNWLDGTSEPPSDRVRRLFALEDAVSRLSTAAHGDARRVRLVLLAPIAGDSVFEAFAADDAERIEASVEAAERAIVEGTRLVRRVPPSARARSTPGAAEDLRLERDSLGLYPKPADPDEDVLLDEELLGPLTPREREILQLLADGMSNVEVAEKLFISQETVKSHVRHILAKLEADTSTRDRAGGLREALATSALHSDDRS